MEDSTYELIKELEEAAMPLLNYLNKYYNPHCYAVVTEDSVEILSGERCGILPIRD